MRYLVALLVLLALQLAPGSPAIVEAQAQSFACNTNSATQFLSCTREQAYASCKAAADATPTNWQARGVCSYWGGNDTQGTYQCAGRNSWGNNANCANYKYFTYNSGCPVGATWDSASGTCWSSEQCLAHNAEPGFINVGETTRGFHDRCVGGCDFRIQSPYSSVTAGSTTFYTGEYMFTGDSCATEQPPIEEEEAKEVNPQECTSGGTDATGREYTFCVKSNGNQCWTASSGKQICWTPGEVGEKTDGPVLQKRNAGTTAIAPTATPPEGSTFSAQGPSITTTTSISNVTINTTTQNYQTDSGVDAGPVSSGEPADGTGGEDDEDAPGSVVGGEGCDEPPVVTGDPILANIVLQTWGTRCATEAANAVKATGEITDCSSPFTVTGPEDDPNTHKLRAIRKDYCPDEADQHPEGVNGDYGLGTDADEGTLQSQVFGEGTTVGADGLDDTGFGWVRTCPQMPIIEVMGATLDFNLPEMCDWMKLGGQLVLILATMGSLRLMAPGV